MRKRKISVVAFLHSLVSLQIYAQNKRNFHLGISMRISDLHEHFSLRAQKTKAESPMASSQENLEKWSKMT